MLHLDKINKINIIYIIVFIFLAFTLLHLYKIDKYDKFINLTEDQTIGDGVNVSIGSPNQVIFTGDGTLQSIFDTKLDKTEHNTHKNANMAAHTNINTFIGTKVAQIEYDNKIKAIEDDIIDNIDKHTTNTTNLNNAEVVLRDEFKYHKDKIDDAMPECSIIMHASNTPPPGWQLCNGDILNFERTSTPVLGNKFPDMLKNGQYCKTPDLRGRFVLGSGPGIGLTARHLNEVNGTETHTLTEAEMPSHNHGHTAYHANFKHKGSATEGSTKNDGDGAFTVNSDWRGDNQPHNNMPPYYVLTYIIKQPVSQRTQPVLQLA